MSEHFSAMQLDALELGSLPADAAARAREHIASCERCRGDVAAREAAHARFRQHVMPATLPAIERRARRGRLRWLVGIAAPVLAAAVVLVVVRPWRQQATDPLDGLGVKGAAAMQVFARQGDEVIAVRDGTKLAPGDQIRFVVQPDGALYLMIASVDGAGTASIYYPYDGTVSARLEAGPRVEVPGSIVLDATAGPERVYALFSDKPVAAEDVKKLLAKIGKGGASAIRTTRRLDLRVRDQTSIVFEKVVE